MPLRAWFARSDAQPGAPGHARVTVSGQEWRQSGPRTRRPQAAGDSSRCGRADGQGAPIIHAAFLAARAGSW